MRWACDTSVLVPALVSWHEGHERARAAIREVSCVPAQVLVECYSVLTRLPSPHRVAPESAAQAISGLPMTVLDLPASEYQKLVVSLGQWGFHGGAIYDAVVAATVQHHELGLLTADRRARSVYESITGAVRFL